MYYHALNFTVNSFLKIVFKTKVNGVENIPKDGGFVLCANHMSNYDPLILRLIIPRQINFMAKRELFSNKLFSYTLKKFGVFPVDRSKNDLNAYREAIKILKNGKVLGIFIQGTRAQNVDAAKNGAAMFAIKAGVSVIPVGINASYKFFSEVKINIGRSISFQKPSKINQETLEPITTKILCAIKNLME